MMNAFGISGNGYYIILAKQVYHTVFDCISYRDSDISFISKHNSWYQDHNQHEKLFCTGRLAFVHESHGDFMQENKLLNLSFEFAVAIVNLTDSITVPKSAYMIDQLARAGTSVGANIHEAQYAQSKKDFIAKLEIALKECSETSYWLKLMCQTNRIDLKAYQQTEKLCGTIRRLLIASCRTAKEND